MASINEALQCAVAGIAGMQNEPNQHQKSVMYTLTVGTHTTPQTFDLTTNSGAIPTDGPFDFDNANVNMGLYPSYALMTGSNPVNSTCLGSSKSSCLTITGPGGSSNNTTLITNAAFDTFEGRGLSHVLVEHMTIKQYPENIMNSTFSGGGTTTVAVSGVGSATFYTVAVGNLYGSRHEIEDPKNFAAVMPSSGSSYSCSGTIGICSSGITLNVTSAALNAAGGVCSSGPQIVFAVNHDGTLGRPTAITSLGSCSTYPVSTSAYDSHCLNCTGGGGAKVFLSFFPTPMTVFLGFLNGPATDIAPGLHVYTNTAMPQRINSNAALGIQNIVRWGAVTVNGNSVYVPPSYNAQTGIWTLVLQDNYVASQPDPWIQEYFLSGKYSPVPLVGLHHDSGGGIRFNAGASSPANVDIVLQDMVWINSARNLIEGTLGIQVLSNQIVRDPEYNPRLFLASSGGFQIGQGTDCPIWGTTISAFVSYGTGDDGIAFFNDYGLHLGIFPQSNISNGTTLTDSTERSVNLANNSVITGYPDGTKVADQCPTHPPLYKTGPTVPGNGVTVLINSLSVPNFDTCKTLAPQTYTGGDGTNPNNCTH